MKVGTRVKYIHADSGFDKESGFYPPIGTLGTVIKVDRGIIKVKWDNGTRGNGEWYCEVENVKEVGFNDGFDIKSESRTKDWNKDEVWKAIHELSDIRARYNLFDAEESGKYHACCLAIKALRKVIGA